MPRAALRSPNVPSPGGVSETPVWPSPGFGSTLHVPLHTLREGEGEGNQARPWTRSLRAPPPAVPDISCGSLSPLLGGGEGDDTRPATFAFLGSRRRGSWLLPGAVCCRSAYSRQRRRGGAAAGRQRRAQRALPPARSLHPSPQRVQAAAGRRRIRHPGVS